MSKILNICVIFGQQLLPLFCFLTSTPVIAQIIPDDTLPVNSVVTPQDNTSNITEGTRSGSNLFHSFEQFSIPTNGVAYFNNGLDIQNIISRVTGSSISNIDGLIKANGTASLFLINPNGFVFGPNASLNIGGSFLGSTASSLNFADGTQFSATAPQATPLLTISVPLGLQFGRNPGAIRVQGTQQNLTLPEQIFSPFKLGSFTGLSVQPGKTLAFVGGSITLQGGILTAEEGRIELGSVENGIVGINPTSSGWTLGYQGAQNFQNIQMSQQALVNASGAGGGSIQLQGAGITLTDGSVVLIQNQGIRPSGSINVNAFKFLELNGTSPDGTIPTGLVNETLGGDGGDIGISTKSFLIGNGAQVLARTYSNAKGGNLTVNASDFTQLIGSSSGFPQVPSNIVTATYGSGNGGNLKLSTGSLIIQGGAEIVTATYSAARGGDLTVNASEFTQLLGYLPGSFQFGAPQFPSAILTATSSSGNGGNLTLSTGSLTAKDGGAVGSLANGSGTGGDVIINANNSVEIVGVVPNVFSPSILQAQTFSSGDAGRLTINTPKLVVRDGGGVSTSTLTSGKAGNLDINASDFVEVSGTAPDTVTPSFIISSGNKVNESLQRIYKLPPVPSGPSGNVTIKTPQLKIANGGLVSVRNYGTGRAGTLEVTANSVRIERAGITASTAGGEGGNITLNIQDSLLVRDNSQISAEASGTGNGGNITVGTSILAALKNSNITANAFEGRGGNIQIRTQGLFRSPNSDITASSQLGINGTVEINTPDVDLSSGLVKLPAELVDASNQIAQSCPGGVGPRASKFVITGRGGLPENPNEMLNNFETVWTDERLIPSPAESRPSSPPDSTQSTNPTEIVEANGWVVNSKGEVILTATAPSATIQVPWIHPSGCHAS